MGAGKTSVAKQLSRLTKYPFYDTDKEVENRTGVSVSWIFEVETESGFRKREAEVVRDLCEYQHIILSTGGGSVVTPESCDLLQQNGYVAYLTVGLEMQIERTSRYRGHRPLIDFPDARERMEKLNEEREPLYLKIADGSYDTDDQSPRGVAYSIFTDYQKFCENK